LLKDGFFKESPQAAKNLVKKIVSPIKKHQVEESGGGKW
jgi:hypothetical protein